MALALLGIGALALYAMNSQDLKLYEKYKEIQLEKGGGGGVIPVHFDRPPKFYWRDPGSIVYKPGMPEGDGATIPSTDSYYDQGVYGIPKKNFVMDNGLVPIYRTAPLYL